jgi:questin oxidase-like protein
MTYATHDDALKALSGTSPELRNGAPNHAPMVVEALAALGRGEAAPAWIEAYRPRIAAGPPTDAAIGENWAAALGDFGRLGAWQTHFRRELDDAPWNDVLDRWLPRLISGGMAAGTHGIIRFGHAARALDDAVTAPRLVELADALAYCAARHRTISSVPRLDGELDLETAVHELPLLPPGLDRRGFPPDVVKHLDGNADFAAAVQRLAPPTDITAALGQLAEIGARLYLGDATRHPLVLLHAVTGPAAVQLLVPYASPELGPITFAYAWQAVAAWAAAFSSGYKSGPTPTTSAEWDEIVDLAVDSGDEHAIKLTEACRRLEALHPSPVFQAAADDWVHRVVDSHDWSPQELVQAGIRVRLRDT